MNSKSAPSVKGGTECSSPSRRSRRPRPSSTSSSCTSSGSENVQEFISMFGPTRQEEKISKQHAALINLFKRNEEHRKPAHKMRPRKPVPSKEPQMSARGTAPQVTVRGKVVQFAVASMVEKSLEQSRKVPLPTSSSCTSSGSDNVQEFQSMFGPTRQEEKISKRHAALINLFKRNEEHRKPTHKMRPRKPVPSNEPQTSARGTAPQVNVHGKVVLFAVASTVEKSLKQSIKVPLVEISQHKLPTVSSRREHDERTSCKREQIAVRNQSEQEADNSRRELQPGNDRKELQTVSNLRGQLAEESSRQGLAVRRQVPKLLEASHVQLLPEQSRPLQVPMHDNVLPRRHVRRSCKPKTMFIEVLRMSDEDNELMPNLKDIEGVPCGQESEESSDSDGSSLGPRMMLVSVMEGKQRRLPTFGRVVYPSGVVRTARLMGRDSEEDALRLLKQGAGTATKQAGHARPQSEKGPRIPAQCQTERPAEKPSHTSAPRTRGPIKTLDSPRPTTGKPHDKRADIESISSRVTRPKTSINQRGHRNPFIEIATIPKRQVQEPLVQDREASMSTWARQSKYIKSGKIDKSNYGRCQYCGREFINTSLLHHEKICETHVPVKTIRKWNRMYFKPKK